MLSGRVPLAGAVLDLDGEADPWMMASPTRAFAVELHRFSWLPSLIQQGSRGVQEALRLTLDWERTFALVTPFIWSAETVERRVFNLACGVKPLIDIASDVESARLVRCLARQARHLANLDEGPLRACERATAAALAGAALAGPAGERLQQRALGALARALAQTVLPDGGIRSRSPEQALELLFDLLSLDDALLIRGREAPEAVSRAIDRLTQGVRFFTLGDGRLAAFQGGEASEPRRISAALAHDDGEGRIYGYLPHTGYHRLSGRALVVMVDAGRPAQDGLSQAACAQPLALEITCGGDRLIANAGWSPDARGPTGFRLTEAASTAVLDDQSCGRVLRGLAARALGPRLIDGPRTVDVSRNENEHGVWLELAHDGWVEEFGILHARRLYLDAALDELRGEDRFAPAPAGQGPARRRAPAFAVRFHLPSDVKVSLARDKRSVLLRGPSNRGWWFRNDAADVVLEASAVFEDRALQKGVQVVLRGLVDPADGARVRWKLTPVEPSDPRTAGRAGGTQRAAAPPHGAVAAARR
jgi:uncharacterized heparinase superfamily protein